MFRTRASALILAVCCLALFAAPEAQAKKHVKAHHGKARVSRAAGVNDPRYADIIMNPVTGEIYHEHDADGKRYPASLTKMMTLYLLFEALEQHRVKLDDNLKISEYATTMPQTNLALTAGDTIEVETAIKALVVRSANDVAVVVGEAIGGNVNDFAVMMTAKARQLGMNDTHFVEPTGLSSDNVASAGDLARASCTHVNASIRLLGQAAHTPDATRADALRAKAYLQLLEAIPIAAQAAYHDIEWQALSTTLSEANRVPERELIPSLQTQCQAADSSPFGQAPPPTTASGG